MTRYAKIREEDITFFTNLVSESCIKLPHQENFEAYTHDETENFKFPPEIVLIPKNVSEVSQILAYCHHKKIPVTTRGAGTGLSGGALAILGGVCLSMQAFNQIVEIDERNLQATVQPGVVTQIFQEAVKEKGLFYPPDPSSRGSCFIGGNVAHNSGGPRAVKYGVVKDYILSLEVVLPNGEVIQTGAKTLKNATGYNLTQLLVGSEGTLGVITSITVKLLPHPKFAVCLLVPFYEESAACDAVSAVFRAGIIPSALEFMEYDALTWGQTYTGIKLFEDTRIRAHLLVEVDGNDMDTLYQECEKIAAVMSSFGAGDILFADSAAQQAELWRLRRSIGEAVKHNSVYKEEDTVVPRAELATLLKGVKTIGAKYGFKSVCYGHAGDGNLHINIVKGDLSDYQWNTVLPQGIREIFQLCKKLGGTLSGEHGIGYVQKDYMDIVFSETQLNLMRGIKTLFDPHHILNPGKLFPNSTDSH